MEKQSISLKSSKEEKNQRTVFSVLLDNMSGIQLGAEVNCGVVIIANNGRPELRQVLLQSMRSEVQGDWNVATYP